MQLREGEMLFSELPESEQAQDFMLLQFAT